MAKAKDAHEVTAPDYDEGDVGALQALARGEAEAHQQKRALDWILQKACSLNVWPYRPGESDRATNVELGRHLVGHQIVKLLRINLRTMRRKQP